MDIRTATNALCTLQKSLQITDPVTSQIKTAYPMPPSRNVALPSTPCWINAWTLRGIDLLMTSGGDQHYTIHSQLFVLDADLDRAADIASAYMVALVTAYEANSNLSGTVSLATLRGGDPTLALLSWNGLGYAGLNLFFDVELYN